MMAPSPKNPSTRFIVDVSSVEEVDMSATSATAAALNMPIATPASVIRASIWAYVCVSGTQYAVALNSPRPARMARLRPRRSAKKPSRSPAPAMPAIEP